MDQETEQDSPAAQELDRFIDRWRAKLEFNQKQGRDFYFKSSEVDFFDLLREIAKSISRRIFPTYKSKLWVTRLQKDPNTPSVTEHAFRAIYHVKEEQEFVHEDLRASEHDVIVFTVTDTRYKEAGPFGSTGPLFVHAESRSVAIFPLYREILIQLDNGELTTRPIDIPEPLPADQLRAMLGDWEYQHLVEAGILPAKAVIQLDHQPPSEAEQAPKEGDQEKLNQRRAGRKRIPEDELCSILHHNHGVPELTALEFWTSMGRYSQDSNRTFREQVRNRKPNLTLEQFQEQGYLDALEQKGAFANDPRIRRKIEQILGDLNTV